MEFHRPQPKTPATGRDIDAYCSRCKLELVHVIVAMDGSQVARVKCRTCGSEHAYRQPSISRSAPKTPSEKKRSGFTANEYDRLLKGRDISRAQPYRSTTSYVVGDIINHRLFGLGVVNRLLADSKIEAGFPAGLKILVHNRQK